MEALQVMGREHVNQIPVTSGLIAQSANDSRHMAEKIYR